MPETELQNELPPSNAACCAQFYEQDWVRDLLGESFHPGGPDLSARLVHSLNLPEEARVLDVACGIGTTTLMMARQFGLDAVGVDFSEANIEKARQASAQTPPVIVSFFQRNADSLMLPSASLDAVVCECAVSTFSNQSQVVDEFARVLKPGGVVGISDMVVNGELPDEVARHVAPWTCMSEARTVAGYQQLFLDAGFSIAHYADESHTLLDLVSQLKRKLLLAGVGKALGALAGMEMDLTKLRGLLAEATRLIDDGTVQYCRMVFAKGTPKQVIPPHEPAPAAAQCDCPPGTCC